MTDISLGIYAAAGWVVQFVLAACGFGALLRLLLYRRPRWRVAIKGWRLREPPLWWLRSMRCDAESTALQERRMLLAGCGIRVAPALYLAVRRSAIALSAAAAAAGYALGRAGWISPALTWNALFLFVLLGAGALFDRPYLEAIQRYRTDRIRREIVAVVSQLLYYTGSRLHLHGKLMRCLPHTRLIRGEMQLLLNEWYHDADAALGRFKTRLGTQEAFGFTETVRSLRLYESSEVYGMLREVVSEYKANIELAKAGRKETTSYVLFVLAGIPILYTFQIFLYPWVQEAQRLFDALNP
ncbi:hypothetical protein [Cohnella nanjingensis]|uniref:Type II secretion system protein GspF domain-containing protein n=1 Tax=Cohnella nanjingensis TaxID=1387779 RepID=A0A7X0RUH9_9BACL|nr:hypothetical protein [Cohnella nanjingensis]MBB6672645.1 hypothetical protein [Cohnella nanjingensis]